MIKRTGFQYGIGEASSNYERSDGLILWKCVGRVIFAPASWTVRAIGFAEFMSEKVSLRIARSSASPMLVESPELVGDALAQTPSRMSFEHIGSKLPATILFIDHTAMLGGGELALLSLVRQLDKREFHPIILLMEEGPLAEKLRPDFETHILSLGSRISKAKKDGLGMKSLFRLGDIGRLGGYTLEIARFIRSCDAAVVHTNSLKSDIIGGVAGLLARTPVIWHVRDQITEEYLPRRVAQAFRKLAQWIPTHIFANSESTLATLNLRGRKPATTIASGVDLAQFPLAAPLANAAGASAVAHGGAAARDQQPQPFRIGLIGRICPWKGQHVFLRAAAQVAAQFKEVEFFVIGAALFGEQEYEAEVKKLARDLGIEDRVVFTGFCSDIHKRIAALDLVVHASTTGEPFGQVIVQGMAASKPVIATNGGGVREIVEDGVTGLLIPMGDPAAMAAAICRLLRDPVEAAAMGRRGRQRVEQRFTIERTAERVAGVYRQLVQRRTGSQANL